jgi:hypothetical protein
LAEGLGSGFLIDITLYSANVMSRINGHRNSSKNGNAANAIDVSDASYPKRLRT